ncbi:hypothetical protein C493_09001 [Natronolimnohabitans innermongolicus JCM 12255]|uniref:Uncharacterized protein n=2 Tax=Natronolimnohabitans innermongolicus TaxID=253107 RepID=L9XAH8_9EURY|nr:hypothetical protein C493_09001 [Natronolimnohabitans innermongolicus JCM 12255]
MGFAGTAAASDQSNHAELDQDQSTTQVAEASSDDSFAIALDFDDNDNDNDDGPVANTGNSVTQNATNEQTGEVTQTNENVEDSLFLDFGGI